MINLLHYTVGIGRDLKLLPRRPDHSLPQRWMYGGNAIDPALGT